MESNNDFINSLAETLIFTENLTLNQRIKENTVDLTNYEKHDGGKGTRVTGKALLENKIENLSVIDVDINKSFDEEKKEMIRKKNLQNLSDDDIIVKTALQLICQ